MDETNKNDISVPIVEQKTVASREPFHSQNQRRRERGRKGGIYLPKVLATSAFYHALN